MPSISPPRRPTAVELLGGVRSSPGSSAPPAPPPRVAVPEGDEEGEELLRRSHEGRRRRSSGDGEGSVEGPDGELLRRADHADVGGHGELWEASK
ncbi:uncharacterized protein A4U43_C06F3980 [Asparagus officinalis]|uniref:Uncharacterized protein n=1 Tax=Asparagus officinalis TaxID=4686 RepID=A0A5P1EK15_ASPOF|nr:uncharacterized protein A4U43_C06F3980 [Asparagus officinalis]